MARPRKPYRLWKKEKTIYYYRLPGMTTWKSTGCRKKTDAEHEVLNLLKDWEPPAVSVPRSGRLRDFVDPYYDWERCPRIAERLADGKRIGRQHASRQRDLIERLSFHRSCRLSHKVNCTFFCQCCKQLLTCPLSNRAFLSLS